MIDVDNDTLNESERGEWGGQEKKRERKSVHLGVEEQGRVRVLGQDRLEQDSKENI